MFDTRNQNSNCEFSEEVVSFIYDEMSDDERTEFSSHLDRCRVCPDEVSRFAAVSGAVSEWKRIEFDVLQTPSITVPSVSKKTQEAFRPPKVSFLSSFRQMMGASSRIWQGVGAIAIITLSIGIYWLYYGGANSSFYNAKIQEVPPVQQIEVAETAQMVPESHANSEGPAVDASAGKTEESAIDEHS